MRVGVVDVGGNTARLLVARRAPGGIERIVEDRVVLGLGAEIESKGRISKAKLSATRRTVADLCARAHREGCVQVDVIVTSPGRQSASREVLAHALRAELGRPAWFVSGAEEAALAHAGAVLSTPRDGRSVAVCDVGGGSTEIAIGAPGAAPAWSHSLDLGSLRLTHRCFTRVPPSKRETEAARAVVREALGALAPVMPAATQALATGGTARALRKLVGRALGPAELKDALRILRNGSPDRIARRFDVPAWRAAVLPAGAILLAEVQRALDVPLVVAPGGLREGAALRLLAEADAAAAAA